MDLTNISITQLAAIIGAVGTIVGAGFTIDSRYAKRDEIDGVKKELRVSLDTLHKQILENEQLKQDLGNNAQAARVLAERNRQELAEIKARLLQESVKVKTIRVSPPPPVKIEVPQPDSLDNLSK